MTLWDILKEDFMRTDPDTGLPILPSGYVWRVTKVTGSLTYIEYKIDVCLARKFLWIKWHSPIDDYWTMFGRGHDLKEAAKQALTFGEERARCRAERKKNSIVGVYPPKKI